MAVYVGGMAVHRGKTSVYLSEDRAAAIEASGKTIAELIDLGLEALTAFPQFRKRKAVKDAVAGVALAGRQLDRANCDHPRARRDPKNPRLCRACGREVQ